MLSNTSPVAVISLFPDFIPNPLMTKYSSHIGHAMHQLAVSSARKGSVILCTHTYIMCVVRTRMLNLIIVVLAFIWRVVVFGTFSTVIFTYIPTYCVTYLFPNCRTSSFTYSVSFIISAPQFSMMLTVAISRHRGSSASRHNYNNNNSNSSNSSSNTSNPFGDEEGDSMNPFGEVDGGEDDEEDEGRGGRGGEGGSSRVNDSNDADKSMEGRYTLRLSASLPVQRYYTI
jgi:hypothetical protein